MRLNICVVKDLRRFLNLNIWACPFLEMIMEEFTSARLAVSQKTSVKAVRLPGPALLQIGLVMRFCIRFTKAI